MTATSATSFSSDQIDLLKEAFRAYGQKSRSIPKASLGPLLHAVGVNALPWEVQDIEQDIGDSFDFDTFLYLVYRLSRGTDPALELTEAIRLFDRQGEGQVKEEDFRSILASLKDPYTPAQVDLVVALVGFNEKVTTIDREAFVKALLEL
jgi:Ca2+-binding EF-hand superfamily protein